MILTHLHYDHAGTLGSFPRACFHVQDSEVAYATGRCMCHGFLRHPFHVEDVVSFVRHVYAGRDYLNGWQAVLGAGSWDAAAVGRLRAALAARGL